MTRAGRGPRALLALLACLAVGATAGAGVASASCPSPWQGNSTCTYRVQTTGNNAGTGSVTVPAGVTSIAVTMSGAAAQGNGGCAGVIEGVLPTTGGEQLSLIAGGEGTSPFEGPGAGGGGGGGAGGANPYTPGDSGGGGGGGSFLFGPQGLIMAAGGAGGASGGGLDGGSVAGVPSDSGCPPVGAGQSGGCGAGGQPGTGSAGGQAGTEGTGCLAGAGTNGAGPASSAGSVGSGGTGGAGAGDDSCGCNGSGGGGGGGGYYGGAGGGGGGDNDPSGNSSGSAGGGGAGSNYFSPQLSSDRVESSYNDQSGEVELSYTASNLDTISGMVSEPDGSAYPDDTVTLSGIDSVTNANVNEQTQTDFNGMYSFQVDPGSYTVTPEQPIVPGDGQILVTSCSGIQQPQACQVTLGQGQSGTANFRRSTLIVTTTQTGTDAATLTEGDCDLTPTGAAQTCTLPQAIEIANGRPGSVIGFNIAQGDGNTFDGNVPQIQDSAGTGMPQITAPTTVDGTSQPNSAQVELSGTVNANSVTYGLVVGSGGAGSTIKGMVVNGYQEMIDLKGGDSTVQGDLLGTDTAGTSPDPLPLGANSNPQLPLAQVGIRVESSGNQIGGPGSGQGNVIASSYQEAPQFPQPPITTYGLQGAGGIYDTAGGNVVQGNFIGLAPGSSAPLILAPPTGWNVTGVAVQAGLVDEGADTIGGSASGDGNLIGGGGSAASGSVVQRNTFTDGGLDGPGIARGATAAGFAVDGAVTVGGAAATPGTGPGNIFYGVSPDSPELLIAGGGAVVQGNVFRDDDLAAIHDGGRNVTIGGDNADDGNLIEDNGIPDQSAKGYAGGPFPSEYGLVALSGNALVEHNTFVGNLGSGAVELSGSTSAPQGVTITDNVMRQNSFGISLGGTYFLNGDYPMSDVQPYPVLGSAELKGGGTEVTGVYDEPASFHPFHSITVDLYAMPSCNGASVQGDQFLGGRKLSISLAEADFDLTFATPDSGYDWVTATATAPDGSTSEFSPCFEIGSHPDPFAQVGVTPTTTIVAITTAPESGSTGALASDARAGKAKRGHGTLILQCPVTATKSCQGTYVLSTTGRHGQTLAHGRFKIFPGWVKPVKLTVTATVLRRLEQRHHLRVRLMTTARDKAKHHDHKNRTITVTLRYNR